MRPAPFFVLGIKRWQDLRPSDVQEREAGGDFEAFVGFYGISDLEGGAKLLSVIRRAYRHLLRGDATSATRELRYHGRD